MVNAYALYLKQCKVISLTLSCAAISELCNNCVTYNKATCDRGEITRQSLVLCNILHCFAELRHYISTLQYEVSRVL